MHKEKEAHQSRPLKVGDRFNVLVERMATGGAGIAKHKKLVVFVPLACPDDELLVEVTRVKKSYVDAKIIEIIKPSVSRRSFYCSIANTCGGCQWQQIEYTQQLKQKKSLLLESLQRHGKLTNLPNINLIECDREFHYRNRVRLHWNGKILGFFTAKSHQLIRVDSCPLAEPSLNSQVPIILDWLKNNKIKKDADIDLFLDSNNLPQFKLKKTKNETFPFSQVNSLINKKLISYVLEKANEKYQSIFDLYCGHGNFTYPLAEKFFQTKVIGIDINAKSVSLAKNLPLRGKNSNLSFYNQDVGKFLSELNSLPAPALFILDPARSGCDKVVLENLIRLRPQRIIYISCDPMTLARDLRLMTLGGADGTKKTSYHIEEIYAFDMFPQTSHIESVITLEIDAQGM